MKIPVDSLSVNSSMMGGISKMSVRVNLETIRCFSPVVCLGGMRLSRRARFREGSTGMEESLLI